MVSLLFLYLFISTVAPFPLTLPPLLPYRADVFDRLLLLSGDTVASLLPRGDWRIRVAIPFEGPTCGLVPLGEKAIITTKGLKWDVSNWPTTFGGSISTSNCVIGDKSNGNGDDNDTVFVNISTTAPIIWTLVINNEEVIKSQR